MFDLGAIDNELTLVAMLFGLSAMLLVIYLYIVFVRLLEARAHSIDEWRDPPPIIYKVFKPIVKLFCADVKVNMGKEKYDQIQLKLSSAGLFYSLLPEELVTLRYVCLVAAGIVSSSIYWFFSPVTTAVLAILVLGVIVGFAYPDIWLRDRVKFRHTRIEKEFPFLLDLIILSMRVGLNYSNALSQSIACLSPGPIKDDFSRLERELRAGKPRHEALLEMAERMDSTGIRNFVSTLNQAEETGGEVVTVLQGQAEQRRTERFQRAEETAGKAPIKLLGPLMMFLFPLIFMLVGFVIIVGLQDAGVLPDFLTRLL